MLFAKIVHGFQLFTIFGKSTILNAWQSSDYISKLHQKFYTLHEKWSFH